MVQSRLPFPDLGITPSAAFAEPDIWIRRLVIVEDIKPPVRVVRAIAFRQGLNIVCTAQRMATDSKPVGHSVGKSLLVRIIRYCLGEDQYCTDTQRSAILAKLEHGYALAILRVKGEDWAVARPLGMESGYGESWCVKSRRIKALFPKETRQKYREFMEALNYSTKACYADIDLPRAMRHANWRDLLGWLSRDQDCHFDHHADWRTTETQAGPRALTREDAHLVMRMALGLVGPDEIGIIAKHRQLLAAKSAAEIEERDCRAYITHTEDRLRRTIKELADEPQGAIFGDSYVRVADGNIQSLQRLLGDPDVSDATDVVELQDALDISLKVEGSLQTRIESSTNAEVAAQAELDQAKSQDAAEFLKSFAGLRWKCSYYPNKENAAAAGCPGTRMIDQSIADPWRERRIEELQQELASIRKEKQGLESKIKKSSGESQRLRERLSKVQSDLIRKRDGVAQRIGLWQERREEATRYGQSWRDLDSIENRLLTLRKNIDESGEALGSARAHFEKQKAELSAYYDAVVKWAIAPTAEGRIEVDGNGVRPETNEVVADSGTTLRAYADVLGFDIGCLTASVCGVGSLPRLWIHDSPRQADSEEQLYHLLMHFVANLERKYPRGRKPSFQYILTTTSPPPPDLNRSPYVRLRLSGREESAMLLKRTFGK